MKEKPYAKSVRDILFPNDNIKVVDINNLLVKLFNQKRTINDSQELIDQLVFSKATKGGYLDIKKSDDNRLEALYWSSKDMLDSYQLYSDVVLLDSTYRTNRFSLPLVVISGVTNEGLNTIFAFALISNENQASYDWLLRSLVVSGGRQPGIIITDADKAIIMSIKTVLTSSRHTLCEWHINQNFKKHLAGLRKNKDEGNTELANKIVSLIKSKAFEEDYKQIMGSDKLTDKLKKYLIFIYSYKKMWARYYTEKWCQLLSKYDF
jgi:hypothetical protein